MLGFASKRRVRAKSCLNKTAYATRQQAERTVEYCHANGKVDVHAYPCPFCREWHVGHRRQTSWLRSDQYRDLQ